MADRYLFILNTLLECSKEIKVEMYIHLLMTPLVIKKQKHSTRKYLSKLSLYTEVAKNYTYCQSTANKIKLEEIIAELKDMEEM